MRDWQRDNTVHIGPHRSWKLPYTVQSLAFDTTGRFLPPYTTRLLRLLVDTRNLGVTVVRDKLFAILPLLASDRHREACAAADTNDESDGDDNEEGEQANSIAPACDYERQPAEIFMKLARDHINAVGLEVLTCAAAPTTVPGLRSWAPDWGTKTPPTSRNKPACGRLELRSPWEFIFDDYTPRIWRLSNYASHGQHGTQPHVSVVSGGHHRKNRRRVRRLQRLFPFGAVGGHLRSSSSG